MPVTDFPATGVGANRQRVDNYPTRLSARKKLGGVCAASMYINGACIAWCTMVYCSACGNEVSQSVNACPECGEQIDNISPKDGVAEYEHPGEDGVAWAHLLKVGAMALIPSVILEIAMPGALGGAGLILGIPIFTYLGYQRPTIKTAFGRESFWTSIVLFMSPILLVLHTIIFASGTEGDAEAAGAVIGGTVLVIGAFVIGIPLGIGFYLLSRRYQIEDSGQPA